MMEIIFRAPYWSGQKNPLTWCTIHIAGMCRSIPYLKNLRRATSLGFYELIIWPAQLAQQSSRESGLSQGLSACILSASSVNGDYIHGRRGQRAALAPLPPPGCCSRQPSRGLFTWHALSRALRGWQVCKTNPKVLLYTEGKQQFSRSS